MDLKEEFPNLLGQSRRPISLSTSSGCNLALLIAYNHLKKRLSNQNKELNKLKSLKMSSEVQEGYSSTHILERKVEQLQRSLQTKITAYNNLEATFKETRENEEALIKHTTETEQMLDKMMKKSEVYHVEREELKKKMEMLTTRVKELESEKCELEEELQDIKNIPEVSVLKSVPVQFSFDEIASPRNSENDIPDSQKHLKQIEALLYENKTLKTNMYWLATELKTVKNKEELSPRRVRHDSGGLEEGRAGRRSSMANGNNNICRCVKNIVGYTRKLERTISTLKSALNKNNTIINELLLKKFGHVPKVQKENDSLGSYKLTESYITIDGDDAFEANLETTDHVILWETQDDEAYQLPELESASVIVPLEELSGDNETEWRYLNTQLSRDSHQDFSEEECSRSGGLYPGRRRGSRNNLKQYCSNTHKLIDDNTHDHDHDSLNESYGDGVLKKVNCPCNLPLSLIHNLELQQTKTYLTSKPSNECKNIQTKESKTLTPVGSPSHTENKNFLELCGRKNSVKVHDLEINT